ncbi:MAG: putative ammonium transporter [Methanosaeta sp. PtaB.Bin039]|nr:MAG: putative ammonium transporter [Methanosaeta sp. PtaB.Bin039]OPY45293.1 MAG: putative ammonium transporter [Methanosaeta sp. PtaU1.Bin028]HOT06793.1 ammonium transporter [Methanotrichaceae archaeon]HQF15991.1 ammonium transporter [Methanotrichaceae archaeon]HQI90661.1 ammonium transporter [Methanotrichaceae archaeon]
MRTYLVMMLLAGILTWLSPACAAEMNPADNAWVLISSALVLLMIPGVGLFYGGMVRRKNAISTIILSFAIMGVITLQWLLFGYTLAFGEDVKGLIGGLEHLALAGIGMDLQPGTTIPSMTFMIFQSMFAVITVSLITGSYVERIKFSSFLVFSLAWATLVYDPIAHWVWGGGWLMQIGVLDFAGGVVVHISAGVSALAVALVIGMRKGYGTDPMEPHNIPTTVIGASLLWFGWFGFNAGSALAANAVAANAFVATHISAAAAATTWMLLSWRDRAPSALGIVTGAVAGLAAITPAAGYVTPLAAIPIGVVASVVGYYSILYIRGSHRVDDSLDVLACHGMGSTWGVLATGIFATIGASGLISGNPSQIVSQIIAIGATWAYSFTVTYGIARVIDATMGLRVRDEEEAVGLDISQHGEGAYA